MRPITLQALTAQMIEPLEALANACQIADGGIPYIYWSLLKKQRPANSLWVIENELGFIGFISGHIFELGVCEITLLVHPLHRHTGVGTALCMALLSFCINVNVTELLFTSSTTCRPKWLECGQFSRVRQELHMRLDNLFIDAYVPRCHTRLATIQDGESLVALDIACFKSQDRAKAFRRIQQLLQTPNYHLFLMLKQDVVIGKAHLSEGENAMVLSDVAIFPEYQNQGYGYELLLHVIDKAAQLGHKNMTLEVDITQKHAIALYEKLGFTCVTSRDYWSISTNAFAKAGSTRYNR